MTEVIVAVVVSYNRRDQLKATLERLLAEHIDHVIVVNNASEDGTREYLDELQNEQLRILNLHQNIGGAGGFEVGLKEAFSAFCPDWVVVMDDDARPYTGAIEAFRTRLPNAAPIVAAAVWEKDGTIAEMNRPWHNPFRNVSGFLRAVLKGRASYHIDDSLYSRSTMAPIDGASFVGLFLSRKAVSEVGFPDGRLFIYGDDVLYTLGASKSGLKIQFDPLVRFEHECETGSTLGYFVPLWKNYYRFRNQILVYRLAAGPFLVVPVFVLQAFRWVLWSRSLDPSNRTAYLRLLRTAVWDGLTGNLARDHKEILAISRQ